MTASEHGHAKVFVIDLPDSFANKPTVPKPRVVVDQHTSHGLQPLSGDKLLFTQSSLRGPNNVFVADLKADTISAITKFGRDELKDKHLDRGESFWFRGADHHRQVQGWSIKPKGFDDSINKGKKWPAIFLIHGGPQGAWEDGWSTRWNPNVFAQQGYWVIAVNPTGSTGFGQGG